MRQYSKNFLAFVFILTGILGFGQEHDDLYYTKSDREKENTKKTNVSQTSLPPGQVQQDTNRVEEFKPTSFLGKQYDVEPLPENFLIEETAEHESADLYKPEKTIEDYTNPNFSTPDNTTEVPDNWDLGQDQPNTNFSDPIDPYQDDPVIVNNYYNDNADWNGYGWINNLGWNMGFGWNSGAGNFWNVGFGWGGWCDPFWDPWCRWNAWGPQWGWNMGWGWNNWGRRSVWRRGGFSGGQRVFLADNMRRGALREGRTSRGGEMRSSSRTRGNGRSQVAGTSRRSDATRYSAQQRESLNGSRSSRYSNGNQGTSTRSGSNSVNQRTRSDSNGSRSGYNNSRSRTSRSSNYGTSRSSGSRSSGTFRSSRSSSSRSSSVRSSSSRGRSSGGSRSRSSGRSSSRRGR